MMYILASDLVRWTQSIYAYIHIGSKFVLCGENYQMLVSIISDIIQRFLSKNKKNFLNKKIEQDKKALPYFWVKCCKVSESLSYRTDSF